MAFNGTEGTFISLAEGTAMTAKYRNEFLSGNRVRKAVFFGKEKLQAILNQTDCEGIRCYFGAVEVSNGNDSWSELTLVMVGADSSENDQLGAQHHILDYGSPCPMQCDTNGSPLT